MRPVKVLLFVVYVIALLGIVSLVFPSGGIRLGTMTIHFPTLMEIFSPERPDYADVTALQTAADEVEKLDVEIPVMAEDTATGAFANRFRGIDNLTTRHLEFPGEGSQVLYPFFRKLDSLSLVRRQVRILHYGDSQIEGDRITHILRKNLQSQFGGSGPGLVPVVDLYNSRAVGRTLVGGWERHALFGRRSVVPHNGFGAMASFSRYTPVVQDSVFADSMWHTASVTFTGSGYPFNQVRVFAGNAMSPVTMSISGADGLLRTDTIRDALKSVYAYTGSSEVTITFAGYDSPDIYGIDLSSGGGVMVDNIAMRGSSGTIFNRMNSAQLRQMYNELNVELFILQFGGNVMPYIKSEEECVRYGNWFYSQLMTLKRLRPSACIIVIGPSDMAIKDKEHYVTYPHLESVRDALKAATFRAGGVYWDMYEAMGGRNSMPAWVEADPPLAAPDYIHFTPRGARLIGNMFYNALIWEYQQYRSRNR